ncbi:MAG: hypothetical protein ACO395_05160 [Pontimonas sp.]
MAQSKKGRRLEREVEARHEKIKNLLLEGYSVYQVCKEVGITPKRVYVVAERWNLPTNPTIWPDSDDECSVARLAVAGWTSEKIGRLFNQAPASIDAILERVKEAPVLKATAKRFGVEEGSPGADRQSRAKASANARRRRRS